MWSFYFYALVAVISSTRASFALGSSGFATPGGSVGAEAPNRLKRRNVLRKIPASATTGVDGPDASVGVTIASDEALLLVIVVEMERDGDLKESVASDSCEPSGIGVADNGDNGESLSGIDPSPPKLVLVLSIMVRLLDEV